MTVNLQLCIYIRSRHDDTTMFNLVVTNINYMVAQQICDSSTLHPYKGIIWRDSREKWNFLTGWIDVWKSTCHRDHLNCDLSFSKENFIPRNGMTSDSFPVAMIMNPALGLKLLKSNHFTRGSRAYYQLTSSYVMICVNLLTFKAVIDLNSPYMVSLKIFS